jgi:hypothetical protein
MIIHCRGTPKVSFYRGRYPFPTGRIVYYLEAVGDGYRVETILEVEDILSLQDIGEGQSWGRKIGSFFKEKIEGLRRA